MIAPEVFLPFAHALADKAGDVIRPYFRAKLTVETKADDSEVTRADREGEAAMREMIRAQYPTHGIWGEEYGKENADAEYVWLLDPVDGTRSFIAGFPTFGTLIALVHRGVPVLGIIDQPVLRERWEGFGTRNPEPETRKQALADALLSTTSPDLFSKEDAEKFRRVQTKVKTTVYGYDCYAYAQLASGHVDLVIEAGLKPHDFCAIAPVVAAAGGCLTDWQGNPVTLASDGHVLAAATGRLHREALAHLHSLS